jgi:hypothetical protein
MITHLSITINFSNRKNTLFYSFQSMMIMDPIRELYRK